MPDFSNVRKARAGDWRELRTIRLEALDDTPEAYGSTYEESLAWSNLQWRTIARSRNYYLGEYHKKICGMASGGYNDDHPDTWWLYSMYVSPVARGSGLATQLVDRVASWARDEGAKELFLHVGLSVARARAFYKKVGFEESGETIIMERDRSIQLVTMVKALD